MQPIASYGVAWSVCLSVCVRLLVTFVSYTKTTEPIEMPFGVLSYVDPRNHIVHGVEIPYLERAIFGGCQVQ